MWCCQWITRQKKLLSNMNITQKKTEELSIARRTRYDITKGRQRNIQHEGI